MFGTTSALNTPSHWTLPWLRPLCPNSLGLLLGKSRRKRKPYQQPYTPSVHACHPGDIPHGF